KVVREVNVPRAVVCTIACYSSLQGIPASISQPSKISPNILVSFLRSVRYQSRDSFRYLVSKKPPKLTLADKKFVSHRVHHLLQLSPKSFRFLGGMRFLLPACFYHFQGSQYALDKSLSRLGPMLRRFLAPRCGDFGYALSHLRNTALHNLTYECTVFFVV